MQEERFDIVDRDDNVIKKWCLESEIWPEEIIRVVTVYLIDTQGKFYIAQRSPNKRVDPLMFEAPAHGRVNSGENYEDAIIREAEEEIYTKLMNLQEIQYFYYEFDSNAWFQRLRKKLYVAKCEPISHYNYEEIYKIKSFVNIREFLRYYEQNTSKFSNAIAFDVKYLKQYFNL
jgi:isopentenyldiphosphate isomerase